MSVLYNANPGRINIPAFEADHANLLPFSEVSPVRAERGVGVQMSDLVFALARYYDDSILPNLSHGPGETDGVCPDFSGDEPPRTAALAVHADLIASSQRRKA